MHHPSIKIGLLEFIDVAFKFKIYYLPSNKKSSNGKPISYKKLYIGAYVLGGNLLATVEHVSARNWLRAALEPVQRVTVGGILQTCLPDSLPGLAMLKPVVDT